MATAPAPRRSGFWPIIIAVVLIIVLGAWWYMSSGAEVDGVDRDAVARTPAEGVDGEVSPPPGIIPEPLPGTPAATGTAGEPSGVTGASTQPGSPVQP